MMGVLWLWTAQRQDGEEAESAEEKVDGVKYEQ